MKYMYLRFGHCHGESIIEKVYAFKIVKMKKCLGKCKARKNRKESSEKNGTLNFSLTGKIIQSKIINEKDVFIFFGYFTGMGICVSTLKFSDAFRFSVFFCSIVLMFLDLKK